MNTIDFSSYLQVFSEHGMARHSIAIGNNLKCSRRTVSTNKPIRLLLSDMRRNFYLKRFIATPRNDKVCFAMRYMKARRIRLYCNVG